jgi:integrator complex subunit 1
VEFLHFQVPDPTGLVFHYDCAEAHRRKKLLRAAQKSIMLWDPRNGARKPPRESADLIFAVGESFDLPKTFQRSIKPDFLLMTIGNTTRGAIERAYDWLIPIISVFPDTISRLPASASCFLLLRAYGTEGEERSQLQNLSSPLLDHVRDSLTGKFGEADAIRAFDLLLSDVASHNSDRRRCARRVLHDAIGNHTSGEPDEVFAKSNCSWMVNILHVEHCGSILRDSIGYLVSFAMTRFDGNIFDSSFFSLQNFKTRAASFERGRILRFVVLALERLTISAADKKLPGKWDFTGMLVELISNRPTVFAATMGSFPDLRSLAISLVHSEFKKYIEKSSGKEINSGLEVEILLCADDEAAEGASAILPLSLLQCACVLLSIWLENDEEKGDRGEAVDELVRMLMKPQETDRDDDSKPKSKPNGLASAHFTCSGKSAIPVESVSVIHILRNLL